MTTDELTRRERLNLAVKAFERSLSTDMIEADIRRNEARTGSKAKVKKAIQEAIRAKMTMAEMEQSDH